jgi:hypothetical protein
MTNVKSFAVLAFLVGAMALFAGCCCDQPNPCDPCADPCAPNPCDPCANPCDTPNPCDPCAQPAPAAAPAAAAPAAGQSCGGGKS